MVGSTGPSESLPRRKSRAMVVCVLAFLLIQSYPTSHRAQVRWQSTLQAQSPLRISLDASEPGRPISELIYGMNFGDDALLDELDIPIRRWGGNAVTRYNWQLDVSNRASDWYFENIANELEDPSALPHGSGADRFVARNIQQDRQTLLTVPLIGWTPKSRDFDCGFRVSKYGAQQETDQWAPDCGNGLDRNGEALVGNDPEDTSTAIGTEFVSAWMQHLAGQHGAADEGGVRHYNLDNEPMLWSHTHRDVHPEPVGYDELMTRTREYAQAIKTTDPDAKVLGPALWGWSAYFYSAIDQADGGSWWDTRSDRRAHGDVPVVEYYLQQLAAYEAQHGQRILDYLDLHFYPQASGVALRPAGDAETQAHRLRSTRALWDPDYTDESWINEPVMLIPRMQQWVDTCYPGTGIAIGEYNWGGLEDINGALAQADVLGIFGQEGVDIATLWSVPEVGEPGDFAFRIFRNYRQLSESEDRAKSRFGDESLSLDQPAQDEVSVFASKRSSDGHLTMVLINKSGRPREVVLDIEGFSLDRSADAERFDYGPADLNSIRSSTIDVQAAVPAPAPVSEFEIRLSMPADTITLVDIPAAGETATPSPSPSDTATPPPADTSIPTPTPTAEPTELPSATPSGEPSPSVTPIPPTSTMSSETPVPILLLPRLERG